MNKWCSTGRLTKDPVIRYSQGENPVATGSFTIAINRRFKKEGAPEADFIPCFTTGKNAEFLEKYFKQGMKIEVTGRIQSGSYTNKEGVKVFQIQAFVEELNFAESKKPSQTSEIGKFEPQNAMPLPAQPESPKVPENDGFMNIPEGYEEELPFIQ